MKKTIVMGLCLTVALALVATAALAFGPGFGRSFGPGAGSGYPAIPNLTAEQSARIKALQTAFQKENDALLKEMAAKGQELRGLRFDRNADPVAAAAKQEELYGLRTKLREKSDSLRTEVRKVLTPEQLAKAPAFGRAPAFGPTGSFGPGAVGFGHMRGPKGRW